MCKNFMWANFLERFIKAVVYSEAKPNSLRVPTDFIVI
jgi:hypothetical protein